MDVQKSGEGLRLPDRIVSAPALAHYLLRDCILPSTEGVRDQNAPQPNSPSQNSPLPELPPPTPTETVEEKERRVARGAGRLKHSQSYICEGDKRDSFYLLGGLGTSGGINWKSTADAIHKHFGSHVEAESLPGHDGSMRSILLYNHEDWNRAAHLAATRSLRESTSEKKVLGGVSTGGLVLIKFAAEHPELVRGLIIVGSPFVLRQWWFRAPLPLVTFLYRKIPFIRPIYKYLVFGADDSALKIGRKKRGNPPPGVIANAATKTAAAIKKWTPPLYHLGAFIGQNIQVGASFVFKKLLYGETPPPPTKDQVANAGYTRLPLKTLVSFYMTQLHARRALKKLQCPVLFIYGRHDNYGTIESAKKMFDKIPLPPSMKKFVAFEKSPHCVMLGLEKEQYLETVLQWKRELDAREAEQLAESGGVTESTTASASVKSGEKSSAWKKIRRLWTRKPNIVAEDITST